MVKTRSSLESDSTIMTTPNLVCSYEGCIACFICKATTTPKTPSIKSPSNQRYPDLTYGFSLTEGNTSLTGETTRIYSPRKTYVEALTGSPSPSLIRDRSLDDVNSRTSVTSDNLSPSVGSVINENAD